MCQQQDDAFSLRHPALEIYDWDEMEWEPFDNYEVIDLTCDSEEDYSSDEDTWLENIQHAYCACGQELDIQECRHQGVHQCRDCEWYDQLSAEEWAAISALVGQSSHQNTNEQ